MKNQGINMSHYGRFHRFHPSTTVSTRFHHMFHQFHHWFHQQILSNYQQHTRTLMSTDENSRLKAKIKSLEDEIVERTRNYMAHNPHHKRSHPTILLTQSTQTDSNGRPSLNDSCMANTVLSSETTADNPKQDNSAYKIQENKCSANEEINLSDEEGDICREEAHQECVKKLNKKQEEVDLLRISNMELKMQNDELLSMANALVDKVEQYEREKADNMRLLEDIYEQTELIEKELEASRQENIYLTKLINKKSQMGDGSSSPLDIHPSIVSQINHLKAINNEYRKSYSRLQKLNTEQEKTISQLSSELSQARNKKKHQRTPSSTSTGDQQLATIIEQTEEQIDELIRTSSPSISVEMIIKFLEKSLTATNRQCMQKWITSSIMKLQLLVEEDKNNHHMVLLAQRLIEKLNQHFGQLNLKVPTSCEELKACCELIERRIAGKCE